MPRNQWPSPQSPPASQPQKRLAGRPFFWDLLLLAFNILVLLAVPALSLLALMDLVILHRPLLALGDLLLAWGCWCLFRRLPL